MVESDYLLGTEEKKEVIKRLKSLKFESIELTKHFYNKFGQPRHGVDLDKTKEIFYQFDKISHIFTRNAIGGKRYSIIYKMGNKKSYYIILILDHEPILLFNAYCYNGEIDKRLMRKYLEPWR